MSTARKRTWRTNSSSGQSACVLRCSSPPAHSTFESVQPEAMADPWGWSVATTSHPASANSATSGSWPTPNPRPERPGASMSRSRRASAMKSHSHILRWSMTSRPSSHIGRNRSAQAAQGGGAQRLGRAQLRAQHDRATLSGPPDPAARPYIRSKLRASSQSVTWRLLAAHSCSAVFKRWWCTSGPKASAATAEPRSPSIASTRVEGMRGTSSAS